VTPVCRPMLHSTGEQWKNSKACSLVDEIHNNHIILLSVTHTHTHTHTQRQRERERERESWHCEINIQGSKDGGREA
jgi:hypothetical protein